MNWNGGARARAMDKFLGLGGELGQSRRQQGQAQGQSQAGEYGDENQANVPTTGRCYDVTTDSRYYLMNRTYQRRPVPLLEFVKEHFPNGDVMALQLSHQMEIDVVRINPARSTPRAGLRTPASVISGMPENSISDFSGTSSRTGRDSHTSDQIRPMSCPRTSLKPGTGPTIPASMTSGLPESLTSDDSCTSRSDKNSDASYQYRRKSLKTLSSEPRGSLIVPTSVYSPENINPPNPSEIRSSKSQTCHKSDKCLENFNKFPRKSNATQ